MRIIGFSKKWNKLQKDIFTTFRFPRKDKEWFVGENVQVYYKPRSKNRELLGIAEIISKEERVLNHLSDSEAIEDGFLSAIEMLKWLNNTYRCNMEEEMNRLTLRWVRDENRY